MGTGAIKLQHALAEEDLHAYVDGLLPPERRAAIEAYLAAHPAEARRVEEYRAQNLRLHALLDGYEQAPIPPALQYLQLKLESALRRQRRFRRGLKAAWSLSVMAAIGIGGYWGYERYQARLDPLVAFTKQATEAHLLYARSDEHRVDAPEEGNGMNVVAWLAQRHTGAPFREPNLKQLGFTLVHSRILPTAEGPAAQLLYRDKEGLPVTLYIATSKNGRHTQFTFMQEGRNSLFYWRNANFSYSLVGELEKDELLRIARLISDELGTSQPLSTPPAERDPPVQRDAQSEVGQGKAAAPADRPVNAAAPAAARQATQAPGSAPIGQITPVASDSSSRPASAPQAAGAAQPAEDPAPAAQPKEAEPAPMPDQAAPQEHKQKEL